MVSEVAFVGELLSVLLFDPLPTADELKQSAQLTARGADTVMALVDIETLLLSAMGTLNAEPLLLPMGVQLMLLMATPLQPESD